MSRRPQDPDNHEHHHDHSVPHLDGEYLPKTVSSPPKSARRGSDASSSHQVCHPHSNHLPKPPPGPAKPPPTRVEDLDPPYSAYPPVSISHLPGESKYAYGMGLRHTVPYATWVFEKWFAWSLLDFYALYFDDAPLPVASDNAMVDQPIYSLSVAEEHVPEGDVQVRGLVQRVSSGNQSTSPWQTFLVKRSKPGGTDVDPGSPWHSGLKMSVVGFPEGSTLNPFNVGPGVTVKIERYENIRRNDLIRVSWDGIYEPHRVTDDEAAGIVDILIFIDVTVILLGNLFGTITVRFTVEDIVENQAGDKYRFSKQYLLDSELDPSFREPPEFERDGVPTDFLDWDADSDADLQIRCFTDRTLPAPNPRRYVIVTVKATLLDGTTETVELPAALDINNYNVLVPLPNDHVANWVGGSFRVSFVYYEASGAIRGQSGSHTVTVVGTPVDMPAPDYQPIDLGLIDPDVTGLVHILDYEPYDPGWIETLHMEHISTTGGNIVYTDPQLAGPPGGTRTITPDILAPFNGKGDTQLYYTVNDGAPGLHGGGGILKTRKSAVLTVQVGPRIADMPKPELQGRIGNNVNPSHVVGNPLLTLPYTGTLDKDRIHWTIVGSALGGSDSGVININPATAGQALNFNVGRKILDLNLNGSLRILYSLERDGPPKVILRSEVLDLTVGAGVFLGRPVIVGASLSPEELNPLAALAGATVLAQINPTLATDRINFDWFSADGIGSTTLDAPGNAATHETSVTFLPRTIAQCIREGGSTIDVQYRFDRGSFPYHSETVSLRLLPLTGLPTPKIDGIDGTILDLSRLDPNARTRVAMWHFIHPNQRMWMRYTGTQGGVTWTEDTYTANLVTDDGVTNGIRPPTPVDKLKLLDDGSALTIEFWVSLAESADKPTAILFGVAHFIVQALPSVLPHPFIGGTADVDNDVTIAPLSIEHNTTVTVQYVGMSDKDHITLKWMYANGTHYETALNGAAGGQVVFNLTSAKVLHRSVNSTVQLRYSVMRTGVTDPIQSEVQTVRVSAIPAASLAGPRINGLASGSTLDLNVFTGNGMASLAKWALSNIGQRAWITCSSAGAASLEVLGAGGAVITSTEAANGLVNKAVLRSWLTALANNARITVAAAVNFSGDTNRANAVGFSPTNYTIKSLITTPVTLTVHDSKGQLANNATTYDTSVTLKGKAAVSQKVRIYENNIHIVDSSVSASGDWSYVRSLAQLSSYSYRATGLYGTQPQSVTTTIKRAAALSFNTAPVSLTQRIWIWRDDPNYAPHSGPGVFTRAATGGKLPLTYSSSNTNCARVDSSGTVSVRGNGSTSISVSDANNVTLSYSISVTGVKYFMDFGGGGGYGESGKQASTQGGRLPSMAELREIYSVYGGSSYRGQKHQAFWSTDSAGFLARWGKNLYTGGELSGSELGNGLTLVIF